MSPRKNRFTDDEPLAEEPKTLKLRLLQNAYVRGELTMGGTIMEFPEEEALKRLKATRLWERI